MYKITSQDDVPATLGQLLTEDSMEIFKEELIALIEGKTEFTAINQNLDAQGNKLFYRIVLSVPAGFEETWSRILISVADITQLKNAEAKLLQQKSDLQHSEKKYRVLFETAPIGIGIAKLDGQILDTNQYMYQLTGYSADEFDSLNAADLYEDISQRGRLIQLLLKTGSVRDFEAQMKKKDGSLFTALLNVDLIQSEGKVRTLAIIRDISEQKRIETQLQENEARTQAFLALIPDLIIHLDKNGRYLSFSGNTADLYAPPETLLGKTILEILPDDVAQMLMHYHQKTLETGQLQTYEYELEIDNKICQFEGRMVPTIEKDQVLLIARNITAQKAVKNQLRENEARTQAILALIPDVIFQSDKNGRILAFTGNTADLYAPPDVFLGKTFLEILPKDVAQMMMYYHKKALETGQLQTYEYELNINNKIRPLEGRMVPTIEKDQVLFIARNITAQKDVENQLRQSQTQLAKAQQIAKLGRWEQNLKTKQVSLSDEISQIYGIQPTRSATSFDEVIKRIHPEDREEVLSSLKINLEIKDSFQLQFRMILPDGSIRFVKNWISVIRDENNKAEKLSGVVQDISDLMQVEDTLRRQKDEFNNFAQFMSHDLNNFLSASEGYVHLLMLESDYKDNPFLEKIEKQHKLMRTLLKSSMQLANAGHTIDVKTPVNLHNLVKEVADSIIPPEIQFDLQNLPTILGDKNRLQQVFLNLLNNAMIHGKPKRIQIEHEKREHEIMISISNDGIRIPSEAMKTIFDLGFSTGKSSGLGLLIVKKIVKAHGWQIDVKSEVESTAFQISIPQT